MSKPLPDLPHGLAIDAAGQATVDGELGKRLFDLAIELEDCVSQPVDIQHILAAIVLGVRDGQIDSETELKIENDALLTVLRQKLQQVFSEFEGRLGSED
ncbi:MAG: hypothetical protein AB8B91_18585 [Rubripirellula sp.]